MPRLLPVHSPSGFQQILLILLLCLLVQPLYAQQPEPAQQPEHAQQTEPTTSTPLVTPTSSPDAKSVKTEEAETPSASTPYYSTATSNNKVGSGSHLMSVTFALLFIVLLIVAVSWFMRRFGSGVFASTSQMKIVATMPLGTRERILLVDVGGQQLLLGVTATQINTLHVFSEPVDIGAPAAPVSDFSRKLMTLLQQKNNQSDTATNNNLPGQG